LHDVELPALVHAVYPIGDPVLNLPLYGAGERPSTRLRGSPSPRRRGTRPGTRSRYRRLCFGAALGAHLRRAFRVTPHRQSSEVRRRRLGAHPQPTSIREIAAPRTPLRCELWIDDEELRHEGTSPKARQRRSRAGARTRRSTRSFGSSTSTAGRRWTGAGTPSAGWRGNHWPRIGIRLYQGQDRAYWATLGGADAPSTPTHTAVRFRSKPKSY
jgi:hypothetical protein